MNKEEFLKRLKDKLYILEECEVNDIIDEYSEHIEEKIKSGSTEKEAIKEFGDINELASDILSAYKVNSNYSEDKVGRFINNVIETTKEVFDKIVKVLSHSSTSEIVKMFLYIVVLLIICALLKIPFDFLHSLIEGAFDVLPSFLEDPLDIILTVIISLSYIVVAFLFFVKMLKEKYLDLYVKEEKIIKETKKKSKTMSSKKEDDVIIEKQIEKKIIYKNERTFLDSIGDLILIVIKAMSVFILIPAVFGIVLSSIGIAGTVIFSIKYVAFFGPIIICVGLLIGSLWVAELIFRFVFSKKGSFTKLFISFALALILCGVGFGVSVLEVSKLTFEKYNKEPVLLETENINLTKTHVDTITCYSCGQIMKIEDSTMNDNEIIIKKYGQDYQHVTSYYFGNNTNKEKGYRYEIDPTKVVNRLIDDLKQAKVYEYNDDYEQTYIEVIANLNTLNSLSVDNGE